MTKINLSYTNNLSDNPNNFIRLCYNLCRVYELEISSMDEFNHDNRNFKVELNGRNELIRIFHDYEYGTLEYEIITNNEIEKKKIEKYIIDGVTKVNYKVGETVYDIYGNKYTVLENTNIPLSTNGARHSYNVKLKTEDGESIEMSDLFISQI